MGNILNNQIICIFGAAGRVGFNLAEQMIKDGASLALADINYEVLESKLKNLDYDKDKVFLGSVDLNSEPQLIDWLETVVNRYGRINGAVNCAYPIGKNYGNDLYNVSLEDFNNNVSIHVGAYFNFMKNLSLYMENNSGGSIINISSIYGSVNPRFEIYKDTEMTMPVEYAAAKSAINHLTGFFAKKLHGKSIRINTISPGGIADNQPDQFQKAYNSFCLNKGLLDVEDIIPLIKFLLSKEAQFINGQVIIIDDGFTL